MLNLHVKAVLQLLTFFRFSFLAALSAAFFIASFSSSLEFLIVLFIVPLYALAQSYNPSQL
jgi:hypothetical protein